MVDYAFSDMTPGPTRAFGRFELRSLLGKSAGSMVWLALDTRAGSEVQLTMPRVAPAMEIIQQPQRLSADGYAVEITTKGIWNTLEVRAPGRVLYRGGEGCWFWTRRGATLSAGHGT